MIDCVKRLNISCLQMSRVSALLAIYGLLFSILGELIGGSSIGWSAIFLIAGVLLIALAVCRMLGERAGLW